MKITLSKAIEILRLNLKLAGRTMPPDTQSAVTIAVEAMLRIQAGRNNPGSRWTETLPDEQREL